MRVADQKQLAGFQHDLAPVTRPGRVLGQKEDNFGLQGIGVLEFVDQEKIEFVLKIPPNLQVIGQQIPGGEQQIGKIQTRSLAFYGVIHRQIAAQPADEPKRVVVHPGCAGLAVGGTQPGKTAADLVQTGGRVPVRFVAKPLREIQRVVQQPLPKRVSVVVGQPLAELRQLHKGPVARLAARGPELRQPLGSLPKGVPELGQGGGQWLGQEPQTVALLNHEVAQGPHMGQAETGSQGGFEAVGSRLHLLGQPVPPGLLLNDPPADPVQDAEVRIDPCLKRPLTEQQCAKGVHGQNRGSLKL